MYKIIETHCHLDYLKTKPLEDTLQGAMDVGVQKIITIAVEPNNFDAVFKLAQDHPQVYFTQGIHPHDAKLQTEEAFKKILERSSHEKFVAVGEIGLDYHYDNSPRDIQQEVFKRQLSIAIECNKPAVIHSRDADEDTIKILKKFAPQMNNKGVIHSFTAGFELAQVAIDLGFALGFNGIITFKNAHEVRSIVSLCPLDQILLETDAPFLSPVPKRGRENTPENLPYILEKIAEIKEISPIEVEEACLKNSLRVFDFKPL